MWIERDGEALETREPRGRAPRWALTLLALALLAVGSTGCTATVVSRPTVYGYVVTDAGTVPADIQAYPYVYYRSEPVYWVDGYWYYRSSGRWVVFVDEPQDLYYTRVGMRNRAWATARYGVRTGRPVVWTTPTRRGGYVEASPTRRRGYMEASPTVRRAPVHPAPSEPRALTSPSRRHESAPAVRTVPRPPSKSTRSDGRSSKPSKTLRSTPPARSHRPSRGR
jgi:hypothetical protein